MVNRVPFIGVQYLFTHQANVLNVAHLRAVQDVGFMIFHPHKGVYIGHDAGGKNPLYMSGDKIPAGRKIPVFASEYGFGLLKGVSLSEAGDVHQYQVACRYAGGTGTTTIDLACDADFNIMLAPVKFPDGTMHDYHFEPKARGPLRRKLERLTELRLPFILEKPPLA